MAEPTRLTRDQWLAIIGIGVAVVGIVVGLVAAIAPDRVRCWTDIGSCGPSAAARSSAPRPPTASGGSVPPTRGASSSQIIVEAPRDANYPYGVSDPPAKTITSNYPVVSFAIQTIVNRGVGVADILSGTQFDAYSDVRIEWCSPNGSTFLATDVKTDANGNFDTALIWRPLTGLGTAGANGAYRLQATDLTSGRQATAQVDVVSDRQTPPESSWNQSLNGGLKAIDEPALEVATSGRLCTAPGVEVDATFEGFTPGATVELDIFRADGEREESQGAIADGQGRATLRSWWAIGNCSTKTTFTYHAVATQTVSSVQESSDLYLTTR